MIRKTMLALGCGVAILVSTVALKVSLSNDGRLNDLAAPVAPDELGAPATDEDDPFGPADDPLAQQAQRHQAPDAAEQRQSASLRKQFVELSAKRAQRMSDEELGQAVEEITRTLADQDTEAEAELEKAVEQLKSVVEKFPGTPSAERANRALEATKAQPLKRPGPAMRDLGEEELGSAASAAPVRPILPAKKQSRR